MNELTVQSFLSIGGGGNSLSNRTDKTFIGIDFGILTTVVSIALIDVPSQTIICKSLSLKQMLEDGSIYESELVPSVVAFKNNRVFVGQGASDLKYELKRGHDIWYSFKMELGEDLGVKYYDSVLKDKEPFCIKNPKDVARFFFMYLKRAIEKYCDENGLSKNIDYAISIPASFEANQRKDLLEALEANNMLVKGQSLIDEPNAAFISYIVAI